MRVSSLHVLILARRLVPTIEGCHPEEEEVLRVCGVLIVSSSSSESTHVCAFSLLRRRCVCALGAIYIYWLGTQLAGAFPDDSPPSSLFE